MTLTVSCAATTALLLLAPALSAQERPDSVLLRFGWPVGMTAIVEQEWTRVQDAGARRDSVTVRSSYRMRVLQHARGRLIVADSFRLEGMSGLPRGAASTPEADRLMSMLGNLQPSYVVSADGEFLELAEVQKMKAVVDTMLRSVMPDLSGMAPEFRQLMERATSPEILTASAAEQWNAMAGTWVGADWEVGEWYGGDVEEELPLVPGMKLPMSFELGAKERLPCTERGTKDDCVRLEFYSAPDTGALRVFMAEFMKKLAPELRDVAGVVQNMRVQNELEVVAEPGTLRPYYVSRTKRVLMHDPTLPKDKEPPAARVDVRISRFRYDL